MFRNETSCIQKWKFITNFVYWTDMLEIQFHDKIGKLNESETTKKQNE